MRTAERLTLGAGLLVLPFIFSLHGEQMREPKARFLALLVALYLAQLLWRKIHPSLGCALAVFVASGLYHATVIPFSEILTLTAALGSCLLVAKASENDIERGLEILECSGLLCAFYAAVIQFPGLDPLLRAIPGHTLERPPVFFGQHTLYGPFAVACFASALFHGRHFRALLLSIPIFLVSSSFTFLAFGVVLFLYALRRFGKVALLGLAAVTVLAFAYSKIRPNADELNDNGRFRVWRLAREVADRRAILGHGAGSFRVIFPILQDRELRRLNGIEDTIQPERAKNWFRDADFVRDQWGIFQHPHNELLLVYFELGLLGVLIALWWAFVGSRQCFMPWLEAWYEAWIFREERRRVKDPSNAHWTLAGIFLSGLANSLGNFNLHLVPQGLLVLWAFVAMTTRKEEGTL